MVSAGFSVVVTKSSHKAAFFILHVLGNLLFSNRVDFRQFVLGVQELDSVINSCTAVLLGDFFPMKVITVCFLQLAVLFSWSF